MINKPLATFPKLNNRRTRWVVVSALFVLCLFRTIHLQLITPPNQQYLQFEALQSHKKNTNFNPKNNLINILDYLHNSPGDDPNEGVVFHWDDWIDLSYADHKLTAARSLENHGFCDSSLIQFASVSAHWLESETMKKLRGMCHLFCLFAIPQKLIVTTDTSFIEVPVISKQRLGLQHRVNSHVVTTGEVVDAMTSLNLGGTGKMAVHNITRLLGRVDLNPNDFIFDPASEIEELQDRLEDLSITLKELKHLEFLKYANRLVDKTDRYFKYPWIYTDIVQGNSHHIAYPFFNRFIGDRERQSVLHHMVRVWFQLMESYEYQSWINYGSLLGWKFNGLNMPWDTDIDIQMPIQQLDQLAQDFNRTLILENPRFGNARYWLEISPTYVRQGNSKNHIDARFIDISTGLYIDITALSHDKDIAPPIETSEDSFPVHCKNWNWHNLDEIGPIQHAFFEGASVYLPNNISSILSKKYGDGALEQTHYHNHFYQKDISMWINLDNCPQLQEINNNFCNS
ncbi:hypothetical protein Cantr_05601 [Candida viswanathii]|uniref:LicD/FKTN/FKRP nucleotidyltransferase domain-containing protein n=1 Tax=Candida viswanathii TaxID=5486 RepID=A0A367XSI9_9ASCO|nr:hypothetical protein Cantr_05601 [Candida viswanathii]